MSLIQAERVTRPQGSTRSVAVTGLVATVILVATALLTYVLTAQLGTVPWNSAAAVTWALLAVLLVVGELQPLVVIRRDGTSEPLTVSTTFALSLVLVAPLSLALVAQTAAVVVDDLWRRRSLLRAAFNLSQYVITLVAARAVYALASGHPFLAPGDGFASEDLLPALLAALTFLVSNNGLVALVVALDENLDPLRLLAADLRSQALTSAILLGLAPVAAVLSEFSPLMLLLLALPLAGVQRSAWIAARRQHEALHDSLTGLPNRELFRLRAERAVAGTTGGRSSTAVMLLDLDHFKEVNDTLGHHVGDGLLRQVAERLTDDLAGEVTVARLGGDEFAVLVPTVRDVHEAVGIANGVSDLLREPVVADGVRLGVNASIGVAVCPDHADNVDTLLQRADIALYDAKDSRGEVRAYRPETDQHTVQRLSLFGDLHAAVDADEFEMYYQPQVRSGTGIVATVEALMRWRHPVRGMVPPDVFIPLAENTGLIAPMTRAALRTSLRTLAGLRTTGHDIGIAVNISARLLSDLELPGWIAGALLDAEVPPTRLTIEVTESTLAADPKRAMRVLQELREIGVRLSVDDFGTGYSSLSYLQRLQPDEVKVDRSFVTSLRSDENNAVIVRSTIELGHGLGLSVVAEGVEDAATFRTLTALGCDLVQGYFVARPMPADALAGWLTAASAHGWPGRSEAIPRAPAVPAPRQVRA